MKNLLITALFIFGSISLVRSQQFSLGPSLGVNYSWIDEAPGDTHPIWGLNPGLIMVYSSNVHWGLGLDLKFSGEGMETKLRGSTATARLNYIRLPLKFIYFFGDFEDDFRPKIYIGPSFGFLVGGKTEQFLEVGTNEVDSKDLYETFDLGATVGAGFNCRLGERIWLNVDVAYTHGLLDIAKAGEGFNRNLNLNAGVAYGFGD